ncbi:MAG: hypothetical protein AAF438_05275 [Pseudomonadota bacterium]
MSHTFVRRLILAFLLSCLTACVNLAGYDQRAYENATSLKPRTIAMVEKSKIAGSFVANEAAVERLMIDLEAAFEYANGIEYNNEAAKNWRDLIGNEERMVTAWAVRWDRQGQVGPALANELKLQFAEAFDIIICLEANKRQLSACPSLE